MSPVFKTMRNHSAGTRRVGTLAILRAEIPIADPWLRGRGVVYVPDDRKGLWARR